MSVAKTEVTAVQLQSVRQAAKKYRADGLTVCRLRADGDKKPVEKGWPMRSAEPEDIQPNENIGLVCGLPLEGSDGPFLVCVDLDSREAIEKADQYLPTTGAIEGRDGKPRSHRFYFVTDVPKWAVSKAKQAVQAAVAAGRSPGPFKKAFNHAETGKRVIDFQGAGGQTVVPPSIHAASGEWRRWEEGCSIIGTEVVAFTELWDAVCRLAEACGARIPKVGPSTVAAATTELDDDEEGEELDDEEDAEAADDSTAPPTPAVSAAHVKGTCRRLDVSMAERVEQCEGYVRNDAPLARSGYGGHNTTYIVARSIWNDFEVTNREEARRLLQVYNQRLQEEGQETWTAEELEHKLKSAMEAADDPRYPTGCKLAGRADNVPRGWADAARLAEGFLRKHTVRFVKQTAFEYRDGVYHVVSDDWLESKVRLSVERVAEQEVERLNQERQSRRAELQAAASRQPPDGIVDDSFIATRRAAATELSKLDKAKPIVAPPVTREIVRNTIEAIEARMRLHDETELDTWIDGGSHPVVLSAANGLLDPVLRTLQPHVPCWFATAQLPVKFAPDAPRPERWLAFLNDVMEGDAERIAVLQEIFGASLDRNYPAKWFAALVGSGDNGKSVALVVLRSLLGPANCSAVNIDELSNNRFAAFQMFGRLANIVGDQGHFESADEGRLKAITGGDIVRFEQKGKDAFVAVNKAKLIFACNTMPTFADKSDAVWERLTAIPFEYKVPAGKKNPAMLTTDYWADELPGILNWALDGLARLRGQGRFTRSAKCEAMKNRTRLDSNPARQFLLSHCEFAGGDAHVLPVKELYVAYRTWCDVNGYNRPLTKERFGHEVVSAFPALLGSKVFAKKDGKPQYRGWLGLRFTEFTEGA